MISDETVLAFIEDLSSTESYYDGSARLSSLFRATEEQIEAHELCSSLIAIKDKKQFEHLLFCFLDISRADIDTATRALKFKGIKRLLNRSFKHQDSLTIGEVEILERLVEKRIGSLTQMEQIAKLASQWMEALFEGISLNDDAYQKLSFLFYIEAQILKERINLISDSVDAYNMKALSRLLPVLTICEERIKSCLDLAKAIETRDIVGRPVLTFEYLFRADAFLKWQKKIGKIASLQDFFNLLMIQREKLVPTIALIGITTIARRIGSKDESPIQWILRALKWCNGDTFSIAVGSGKNKFETLIADSKAYFEGPYLKGSLATTSFARWIGPDMLSLPAEGRLDENLTAKELVARVMRNESLLMRMLDNPKIYGAPRIIENIVKVSRSIAILTKIATTRALYTGESNRGVPFALLQNPTNIPFSLLRHFINTRYVSIQELKKLLKSPHTLRREVYDEAKRFCESRA